MTDKISTYEKDLNTYLVSKLPDLPVDVAMEISAFVGHRTGILLMDVIEDRDVYWRKQIDRMMDPPRRSRQEIIKKHQENMERRKGEING